MYLWRYLCGIASHIWRIISVSSLRFGCCGLARTLRFNKSHTCSIGFKLGLLQAIEVFVRCLLQALSVCFLPRDMVRCSVRTSNRNWHGCEVAETAEWHYFGTSSHSSFLEWAQFGVLCVLQPTTWWNHPKDIPFYQTVLIGPLPRSVKHVLLTNKTLARKPTALRWLRTVCEWIALFCLPTVLRVVVNGKTILKMVIDNLNVL